MIFRNGIIIARKRMKIAESVQNAQNTYSFKRILFTSILSESSNNVDMLGAGCWVAECGGMENPFNIEIKSINMYELKTPSGQTEIYTKIYIESLDWM